MGKEAVQTDRVCFRWEKTGSEERDSRAAEPGAHGQRQKQVSEMHVGTCFGKGSGCPSLQRPAERERGHSNSPPASVCWEPQLRTERLVSASSPAKQGMGHSAKRRWPERALPVTSPRNGRMGHSFTPLPQEGARTHGYGCRNWQKKISI